jgi:hypothetical protein
VVLCVRAKRVESLGVGRGRRVALGVVTVIAALLAACGGGGGGSQPLGPTPTATSTPMPTAVPSVAVELAPGVAISTVVAILDLASQSATASIGGGAAGATENGAGLFGTVTTIANAALSAALPARATAGGGNAAATSACPLGGTLNGSCTPSGNSTTVNATLSNCAMLEPGTSNVVTASGGLVETVALANACGVAFSLATMSFTARFTNFSETVTDPTGTVLERFTGNFTVIWDPAGEGCAGANGTQVLDGSLNDETDAGAVNMALTAHALRLQMTSSGSHCTQVVTVTGGLDINDQGAQRVFSASFTYTQVSLFDRVNNAFGADLFGSLNTHCLGDVQFQTVTPLQFPGGSECPTAGELRVTRGDSLGGSFEFSTRGLGFVNAGGIVDRWVPNCAAAAQCSG